MIEIKEYRVILHIQRGFVLDYKEVSGLKRTEFPVFC